MNIWKPPLPPCAQYKKDIFSNAGEVADFIFQIGEYHALRQPSSPVPLARITTSEYKEKFAYIKGCLRKYRQITGMGRGIAGVQIGIPERFAIIYQPEKPLLIINPEITAKSEKKLIYPEMCMSANPIIAPVVRPAWIECTYFDEDGEKQTWTDKADTDIGKIMNRVFQHEIDHMEGIVNIDLCQGRELMLDSDPSFYKSATFSEVK